MKARPVRAPHFSQCCTAWCHLPSIGWRHGPYAGPEDRLISYAGQMGYWPVLLIEGPWGNYNASSCSRRLVDKVLFIIRCVGAFAISENSSDALQKLNSILWRHGRWATRAAPLARHTRPSPEIRFIIRTSVCGGCVHLLLADIKQYLNYKFYNVSDLSIKSCLKC
jgi:hypothetical protein